MWQRARRKLTTKCFTVNCTARFKRWRRVDPMHFVFTIYSYNNVWPLMWLTRTRLAGEKVVEQQQSKTRGGLEWAKQINVETLPMKGSPKVCKKVRIKKITGKIWYDTNLIFFV